MYLLKRRGVFMFAAAYGAGVTAAYCIGLPALPLLIIAGVLGLASGAVLLFSKGSTSSVCISLIIFYLAVAFAGGSYVSGRTDSRPVFESAYNVEFSGRMTGSPYTDNNGERFVCRLTDVEVNGLDAGFDMRLYLRGDEASLSSLGSGQRISGTGHVICPEASTNPHEYDFGDALWNEGMGGFVSVNIASAEISGSPGGFSHMLYRARTWLGQSIDAYFPRCSELVRALILGDRRDMDDDIRRDFSIAGVAHLLAISGLHVTMIAAVISALLKKLTGAWSAAVITIICLVLYGLLTSFSPSITRAVIMYSMVCLAPLFGRPSEGTTRLAAAFTVILLIDPLSIADPGFVLSFSASAGLIWLSTPVKQLLMLDRIFDGNDIVTKAFRYIAELFCTTLCAQIATYPAIAMFYGTFSLISVFSNLLLVPMCLVSLIASYIGLIIPALAVIPDALLALMTRIVGLCADVSWAEISVTAPRWWLWLGTAAVGLLVSEISILPRKIKPFLTPVLPVLIILSIVFAVTPGARIVFLDAGQADCAVITIDDYTCVVDLGEDGQEAISYIKGEGLEVDALFISHPHDDHAGGLCEFAAEHDIGMIYVSDEWFTELSEGSIYDEWHEVIGSGTEYTVLSPGDRVAMADGAYIEILDCAVSTGDSGNDSSLVMLLVYGDSTALFTGDARMGVTPDIDILKVGHHGSRDATDAVFLASATPETAVISAGRGNSYGHPHSEVLSLLEDCGADIYRTDLHGAVTVMIDKDGDHEVITFMEDDQ